MPKKNFARQDCTLPQPGVINYPLITPAPTTPTTTAWHAMQVSVAQKQAQVKCGMARAQAGSHVKVQVLPTSLPPQQLGQAWWWRQVAGHACNACSAPFVCNIYVRDGFPHGHPSNQGHGQPFAMQIRQQPVPHTGSAIRLAASYAIHSSAWKIACRTVDPHCNDSFAKPTTLSPESKFGTQATHALCK